MPKKKSEIVAVKRADHNHQVLSVRSFDKGYMKSPCPTCPWRKDARINEFPAEAFRHSATTACDGSMKMFSCHSAGAEHPKTCAGFLLRGADDNFAVRIAIMKGDIDLRTISDGGLKLYPDYYSMAVANGVSPDDESLANVVRYPEKPETC